MERAALLLPKDIKMKVMRRKGRCHEKLVLVSKLFYTTFFQFNLTEFIANTTSLSPISKAPKVGLRKPSAATGIAMILYKKAHAKFCLIVK
jgi:hypothetical protein